MKNNLADEYVVKLNDIERFKGDTFSIPFEFFYDDGTPINLNECIPLMTICPYGKYQDEAIITKVMLISDTQSNLATAEFIASDTENIDGNKFSYQPVLVYDDTYEGSPRRRNYRRAEGDLLLRSDIKYDDTKI